jgi:hypothetical protein
VAVLINASATTTLGVMADALMLPKVSGMSVNRWYDSHIGLVTVVSIALIVATTVAILKL